MQSQVRYLATKVHATDGKPNWKSRKEVKGARKKSMSSNRVCAHTHKKGYEADENVGRYRYLIFQTDRAPPSQQLLPRSHEPPTSPLVHLLNRIPPHLDPPSTLIQPKPTRRGPSGTFPPRITTYKRATPGPTRG